MRRNYALAGGLAVAALAGWLLLPRTLPKVRLALRRLVTLRYVSGVPAKGRASADPARGHPA
jgi:hypothetical protein